MNSLLHVLYDVRHQAKSIGPVLLGLRRFFTLLVSTTEGDCQGPGMLCGVYQQGLLQDRSRQPTQLQGHHCPLCCNAQPPHPPSTQAPIYSSAHFQHHYRSNKTIQHPHTRSSPQTDTLKLHSPAATHADSPHISKHNPQPHTSTIANMPPTKSVAPPKPHITTARQCTCPATQLTTTNAYTSTHPRSNYHTVRNFTVVQFHNPTPVFSATQQPHDATVSTAQHKHSLTSRQLHYPAASQQHIQTTLYPRIPFDCS